MTDWSGMKLGKQPASACPNRVELHRYVDLTAALATVPDSYDYLAKIPAFGMHLNDRVGCCVEAAAANAIEANSGAETTEHIVPDSAVQTAYEAVGGYVPGNPATDNGTDPEAFMTYWQTTGVDGHVILGHVHVDPTNEPLIKLACYWFGGLQLGIELPNSAKAQAVWDVPPEGPVGDGAPGSWGGHMVYIGARNPSPLQYAIETWNERLGITPAFIATYNLGGDLYAVITQDWVAGAESPVGLDKAQLIADLAVVSGQPAPSPVPTSLSLSAQPSPATAGQPVTLAARVTSQDGSAPGGQVVFSLGPWRAPSVDVADASVQHTPDAAGTVTATATYGGDAGHLASSASIPLVVQAAAPQHFTPSGPAAAAWQQLAAGGVLAKSELELLLDSDPTSPAAPAWKYLRDGGSVQALLDSGWGVWFRGTGAA